jgi:hypothetical protein
MECVHVAEDQYDEILVCTYTGWVFGLSTESMNGKVTNIEGQDMAPQLKVKVQQMQ